MAAAAVKREDSESAGSCLGSIPTSPSFTMFPFVPLLSQEISKTAFSQAGLALEKPTFSPGEYASPHLSRMGFGL